MANSFFKANSSEAGGNTDFTPVPEGTYEAIVSEVDIKTFSTGNKGLSVKYTIRDDVDQAGKKRVLFDNAVVTEKAMFKFHQFAKVATELDGKDFKDADHLLKEFARALKGKPLKVTIKHDPSRDNFIERVVGLDRSELGAGGAGSNPFAGEGKAIEISDDDLPF